MESARKSTSLWAHELAPGRGHPVGATDAQSPITSIGSVGSCTTATRRTPLHRLDLLRRRWKTSSLTSLPQSGTRASPRSTAAPSTTHSSPPGFRPVGCLPGLRTLRHKEQQDKWGGTAGNASDPCYHQACDTFTNVDEDALDEMTDAIAHVILTFAMTTSAVQGTDKGQRQRDLRPRHSAGRAPSNSGPLGGDSIAPPQCFLTRDRLARCQLGQVQV